MTSRPTTVAVLADPGSLGATGGTAELVALAAQLGDTVVLIHVAPTADVELPSLGADSVVVAVPDHDPGLGVVQAEAVAAVVADLGAELLLTGAGLAYREVAAHLAVSAGAAVVTDVTAATVVDGELELTVSVFAGAWTSVVRPTSPLVVAAVKPGAATATGAEGAVVPTVRPVTVSERARRVTLLSSEQAPHGDRPDLSRARSVVVAGRGVNGDLTLVDELADLLGAAVGATRVVTDEGWLPRDTQIGQTGVSVSPQLYVGVGVSGAVHHRGGMQASGTVVAVNDDPDAPIFEIADFGIVGDLFEVLPQTIAELKRLQGA